MVERGEREDEAPQGLDSEPLTTRGLRVLVVDDHELILWGTRVFLCRLTWVQRCVQARNAEEALELAGRYHPHVAIVDLMIGDESGLDVCAALRREVPDTKLLLTSGIGDISRARALSVGAAGFVPKEAAGDELLRAIRALHAGDTWFPAAPLPPRTAVELSRREHDVLQLMALGATNREIAQRMHLAPDTVKQYASNVYRKLEANNRAAAVHRAQQIGLIA
jgi:DNA-binding NarL/FixJ family response regulator